MNAYRNYSNNTSALSKNLEKLSSGYRINRAGDDAAGLAISEKMRAQISGLEQASNNVKDGISLVQTGEGALQEVQDMLNRMVTLAEESANGTYQDSVDRENLQSEMDALKEEINRIADSANFNGINLLDGSMASKASAADIKISIAGATETASGTTAGSKFSQEITVKAGTSGKTQSLTLNYVDKSGNKQTATLTFTAGSSATATGSAAKTELEKLFGSDYKVTNTAGKLKIEANDKGADLTHITSGTQSDNGGAAVYIDVDDATRGKDDTWNVTAASFSASKDNNYINIDGTKYQIVTRGSDAPTGAKALYIDQSSGALNTDSVKQIVTQLNSYGVAATVNTTTKTTIDIAKGDGVATGGLTLQIGDTSDSWNQMTVSISDMHTTAMGIDGLSVADQASAASAISVIKDAINYVSSTRGTLGATQNRLEHTSNNLSVMTENIQDAESTIRDTDIADEMTAYTKNQILVQSAQAMLAQANSVPQGVLQLLQ
jgi:flagellin